MADTIKERCVRRLEGMKALRQDYEAEIKEIARYTMPARSRFLSSEANKRRTPNRSMNNSHGIFAMRTLQGGMTSGLSSQSRPWFTLGSTNEAMMADPEVKAFWAEVERRMYLFLSRTNFYGALKTGYLEMGAFGTEACVMVEHPREGAVCHQLTFGEYWIALNDALQAGELFRRCDMTIDQAVGMFGLNKVSEFIRTAYSSSRKEEVVTFYHAIEENPDYEPGRLGWRGKPWRSVYWDEKCGKGEEVASVAGYDEQPFWAPRWDTVGADAWGQGPGHDALPDLRELQLQVKRKAEATDHHVHPEKVVSSKVRLKNQPKSVVSIAGADNVREMVSVPYQVPYQSIGVIGEDVNGLKQSINEATYADLFMAITNMQGIQPRNVEEIASRNEEKLTQLGPVIERVNNEKLEVALQRTFGIMERGRLLPPAPDALRDDPNLKIEYVSILTQMQRMVGLGQIERTFQFVGGVAGLYPEARYKLDPMEMIDEYARRGGAPPKILRSNQDAQADADAEAEAKQQAEQTEMAAKLAPAANQAVDAARLAAELPVAGTNAVDSLVPVLPR